MLGNTNISITFHVHLKTNSIRSIHYVLYRNIPSNYRIRSMATGLHRWKTRNGKIIIQ